MLSILLVDDDSAVRTSLRMGLNSAGFQVKEAADGNQALRELQHASYDWIVTDIIMPDREGIDLIRTVRRQFPDLRIVAMSGGSRGPAEGYLKSARLLGAHHTLQKPFAYPELVALLSDPITTDQLPDRSPSSPTALGSAFA